MFACKEHCGSAQKICRRPTEKPALPDVSHTAIFPQQSLGCSYVILWHLISLRPKEENDDDDDDYYSYFSSCC